MTSIWFGRFRPISKSKRANHAVRDSALSPTSRSISNQYVEIFSAEPVQSAVAKLAVELTPWAHEVEVTTEQQRLGLRVLRSIFLFFTVLLKSIRVFIVRKPGRQRTGAVPESNDCCWRWTNGILSPSVELSGDSMD